MVPKGLILHGKRRPDCPTFFASQCDEAGDIFLIKKEIILVDEHFVAFLRQPFLCCQFSLAGCVRSKQVSLVQPKWIILNPQIPCPLIKRRNTTLILKDDLEHISDNYSTKIQKQGQSTSCPQALGVDKFVWDEILFLEY